MFHEGMTPGEFRTVSRFPAGKERPERSALAGTAAVAGAMLEACGLGEPNSHESCADQPAAHFHSVHELPGPYISFN